MKAYKEVVTKYYKQTDTTWVQPTLTENGTFGGSNMAVDWEVGANNGADGIPYRAFYPNDYKLYVYRDEQKTYMKVFIYYPTPIRATNISFNVNTIFASSGPAVNTKFYGGSYKGDMATLLLDIGTVNDGTSYSGAITATGQYQYFTLYAENQGVGNADSLDISNIKIDGVHTDIVESTASDYSFYRDEAVYSAIKENDTYYVVKG